jgi:Rrf2 family protein
VAKVIFMVYRYDLNIYNRRQSSRWDAIENPNSIWMQKTSDIMFISRECDYAIRIVRSLADYGKKNVKDICDKEDIPQPYAHKILRKLTKSGIVQSYRGITGGYELAKKTDRIFLMDIILSIEEQIVLNECMMKDYQCKRNTGCNKCQVHLELIRIQDVLAEKLTEKSMFEILNGEPTPLPVPFLEQKLD